MNRKKRQELEQQAQAKLSEAQRLIDEAGELAKEGQFVLHFGETGTFIPLRYKDPDLYREEALEELKTDGWERYDSEQKKHVTTPWDLLSDEEKTTALDHRIESIIDSLDVPWEYREYEDSDEGTDDWWTPSRC